MPDLPKVYFSYAWGDDETPEGRLRAEAADALYRELKAREARGELQVMIDREQMGYKSRIRDFTRQYGNSSILIILIISEKYLLSPYCMGEVVEILSNKDYRERIFPVVLPDANLKDGVRLAQYYTVWENRKRDLSAEIEHIQDKTYAGPLIEQQRDIAEIIRIIAQFTTEMGDTLTARPPDYAPLLDALDKRIAAMADAARNKTAPAQDIHFDKQVPTPFDCFCCNRDGHYNTVARFLADRAHESILHFFLPSFHEDTPESFVSRIYHEPELFPPDNRYTPEKRSQAGGGEHQDYLRLTGDELRASTALREVRQQIHAFADPNYPENILFFFVIRLRHWTAEAAKEFFGHIAHGDDFPGLQGKKIRIFYWLDLTGCQQPGPLEKLFGKADPLEAFKKRCPAKGHICFLDPLPEVDIDEVKIWFSRFCWQAPQYQPRIEIIFQDAHKLRMAIVENHLSGLVQKYYNTYR